MRAGIAEAIEKLMSAQMDFVVRIVGPAFTEEGHADYNTTLELREIGYAQPHHKKGFEVVYDGRVMASGSLSEMIDEFDRIRTEKEVGGDFVDLNFSGHGSPGWASKKPIVIKVKIPPNREVHSWVYRNGALGFIVAKGDFDGWYRVWFGSGEIMHTPSTELIPCDAPPEVKGHVTPTELEEMFRPKDKK